MDASEIELMCMQDHDILVARVIELSDEVKRLRNPWCKERIAYCEECKASMKMAELEEEVDRLKYFAQTQFCDCYDEYGALKAQCDRCKALGYEFPVEGYRSLEMMSIQQKYEEETGQKAMYRKDSSDYHTLKYVEFLENTIERRQDEVDQIREDFAHQAEMTEEADNEVERMRILLKSALARKEIDRTHEGLSQAYQTHLEEYNVED